MIGFRGISDDVQLVESEASGPTKEAQEATNLRLYERALREQRSGCDEEARASFAELLEQPLLRAVDEEALAQEDRVESAPLLKYLCFKNMAVLSTKRQEWDAAVDYFAKAVSIDGTDVVVWYRLGAAAYAGRHFAVARYALEQGLGINPQHWLTARLLVRVLSTMGNDVASRALAKYVRSADPGYKVEQTVDLGRRSQGCAQEAKRQCISVGESEQSVGTTRHQLNLVGPSWQELVQELISLAVDSVKQGKTDGFRRVLHVDIITADCATDNQASAASEIQPPLVERQVSDTAPTRPENASFTDAPEVGTDSPTAVQTVEASPASQSVPDSSPRKSERKKRPSRQDEQHASASNDPVGENEKQLERATLRLAKFTGTAAESADHNLASLMPSRVRDQSIPAQESSEPSVRAFVVDLERKGHSLLCVVRMVLTALCSEAQRRLPETLCSELLQLHGILKKHSSVDLSHSCSMFLAELYFSAHQTTDNAETKAQLLRECYNLIGSIHFDGPAPSSLHDSNRACIQARLCWLRGHIAESAQNFSTAHACFASCLAWIQHTDISEIAIANASKDKISTIAVQHRLDALEEKEHTKRLSQLFAAGEYDVFTSEIAPRLESKNNHSTPEEWCTLLNQLKVSSDNTDCWNLLFQCHALRLQHALSTKCGVACRRILSEGADTIYTESEESVRSDGSAVVHEVGTLLNSLQRGGKLSCSTLCSSDRAIELMHLVARGLEQLEQQSSVAAQPILAAWECFARLWLLTNAQDVPRTDLKAKCQTCIALLGEIKGSCDLDKQVTAFGRPDQRDNSARQSLVRVIAVGLLKLLHAAHGDDLLGQDAGEVDSQESVDADGSDLYYNARKLLDWCLLDLHGIEFPESTLSYQHRQKKDHLLRSSPGMEAEEAFYWYWYAGLQDCTSVLGNYAKKWKDLQLQFIDLVQKASEASFQHRSAIEREIDAVILGTQTNQGVTTVKNADLTGMSRIHLVLHHEHATVKHSYMNQTFFEDNSIDQPTRRGKQWSHNWDKELRELAALYRTDLSINPMRADSWQSLGQCYFRLLDNLLDQYILGNTAAMRTSAQENVDIFCGSAMDYNQRARNCFLRALELDPSSHETLDLLGFLAFVQIRHGYRTESVVSEAIERFTKADAVAQQNGGADEWMYPFMLGKLRERQSAPPSTWMPLYWEAKRRHKDMCDKTDKAELIYRLHASRLKAALNLGEDDIESWRLLLRQKSSLTAADDTLSLEKPLLERRKIVVDSAVSKLLGLLKKGEKSAWGLEGMKWFYKSRYAVSSAFLQLGEPSRAAEQLSALFDIEKERARHFWKMHTYKLTDFGDFSFITERHYDRWRMKCLYLYVQLLSVLQDECSTSVREKRADAEIALLHAKQRRDKAESSSSKSRWQQDVTNALAEFVAARRDAERGQLLKLERALKRGNDKRVLNRLWSNEGRLVAIAARYAVLLDKTRKLEEDDDKLGVSEVVDYICNAVEHDGEIGTQSAGFISELQRADKWLRDVYELLSSIRSCVDDTARTPAASSAAGSSINMTSNDQKSTPPTRFDNDDCLKDAGFIRFFSDLKVSEPPPLENLSAKDNCLNHLSGRGLEINHFSAQQVECLLQRRFSRFMSIGPQSAVPLETIVSYCEKIFSKFPLEDKEFASRGLNSTVLVHSHIKACAKAEAEAAEKVKKDRAAQAKLAAAEVAQEHSGIVGRRGNAGTELRNVSSVGRLPGPHSSALSKQKHKSNRQTKRRNVVATESVGFEVTLREYLHAKLGADEPVLRRPRLAN